VDECEPLCAALPPGPRPPIIGNGARARYALRGSAPCTKEPSGPVTRV